MTPVFLASTSEVKRKTFAELLGAYGYDTRTVTLDIGEIQSVDVREVCRQKAASACRRTRRRPLLVDDTGLEFPDIGGAPGGLLDPFLKHGGVALLDRMTRGFQDAGRCRARYVCALAWVTADGVEEATGSWDGWLDFSGTAGPVDDTVRNCSALFSTDPAGPTLSTQAAEVGARAYLHRQRAVTSLMERVGAAP